MQGIKTIILAAGQGNRMRPLSNDRPKAMIPLVNMPILEHVIDSLKENDLKDVIINVRYPGKSIIDYFQQGNKFSISISYLNEKNLMGSAGEIKKREKQFNDTFLVIYGDSLFDVDLNGLIKFHKEKSSLATIVYHEAPDPTTCGIFLTDNDERIMRFQEKPKKEEVFSNKASAAIYALEPEILQYIPADQTFDFAKDLFPQLVAEKKPIYGYPIGLGYRYDIGTIAQYRQSHIDILEGRVKKNVAGRRMNENIWIGENTEIDKTAEFEGPIVIGRNCKIGKNVMIEKNTVIGDNVDIGRKSVIKESIIWENTHIGTDVRLDSCIIGANCRIANKAMISPNLVLASNSILERR